MFPMRMRWLILVVLVVGALLSLGWLVMYNKSGFSPEVSEQEFGERSLSEIPIGVAATLGEEWFATWARENDMLVVFGNRERFDNLPRPLVGKVAWNVASMAHARETKELWQGNVDVLIYDYELWEQTPQEERDDPDAASRGAQALADEASVTLIMGTSWRVASKDLATQMIRENAGEIDWSGHINRETLGAVAKNVGNYGTNATGLRAEYPEAYRAFFDAISEYVRSINPTIGLWPVLDARNQSAEEMYELLNDLTVPPAGVVIMGGPEDREAIEELVGLMRG